MTRSSSPPTPANGRRSATTRLPGRGSTKRAGGGPASYTYTRAVSPKMLATRPSCETNQPNSSASMPTLPYPSRMTMARSPLAPPTSRRRRCVASKSRSSLSSTPPTTIPATPMARARVSASADAREPPTRIRPVAPTSIEPARSSSPGSVTAMRSSPWTALPLPPTPVTRAPATRISIASAVTAVTSPRTWPRIGSVAPSGATSADPSSRS